MTRYTTILALALCALAPFLLAACGKGGGGY
jgi:predicted small secreted protein